MQNGYKYVYRMGMGRMDINMCTVWMGMDGCKMGMDRCRMDINMYTGWAWIDAEWI